MAYASVRELSLRTVNARVSLGVRLSMLVLLLGMGWDWAGIVL